MALGTSFGKGGRYILMILVLLDVLCYIAAIVTISDYIERKIDKYRNTKKK